MKLKYFSGLNTLRFAAAFLVLIFHANITLEKLRLFSFNNLAILKKGGDAVDFFFTLSGFLITYLLIDEINRTGTVSIKKFYLRRVYRIWPLYFFIVIIGFLLLGYIYPKVYHKSFFEFTIPSGLVMFIFFLPNYAARNYHVGLLNPLWSIGVEEQFYLFWAPLLKIFRRHLFSTILIFIFISILFYSLVSFEYFSIPVSLTRFFLTQKFYLMAIGSLFGYIANKHTGKYNDSIFTKIISQWLIVLIILWHYLFNKNEAGLLLNIFLGFLYGFLIINISSASKSIIKLEYPRLIYLGSISYGIYMWHMPVDYLLRSFYPVLIRVTGLPVVVLSIFYYFFLFLFTTCIASISYKFFEMPFLQLKDQLSAEQIKEVNCK